MGHLIEDLGAVDAIGKLAYCDAETEACSLVLEIVRSLGADWFAYMTLLPSVRGDGIEGTRCMVGCNPELRRVYTKRMWSLIDPYVDYARSHSAPILGSKVKLQTIGQVEMRQISIAMGFRSALVVPTHSSMGSNKRMGLLYVGSEDAEHQAEPLFEQNRVLYGALGSELLLWWNARLRRDAMRRYGLLEIDIEMLQYSRQGKVAFEIAAIMDMKVAAVYKRLSTIKEKFDVVKIGQAVHYAEAEGLLE